MSRRLSWMVVLTLTLIVIAVSTSQSIARYHEFRSGFSWDLAYYNQWFWAVTRGDGLITVRPGAAYAFDGPSVWKMNYLAPIRVALLPLYALFPDPRTLLVVQNVIFWLSIPAAYTLTRSESRSEPTALSAAALVPLTPLAWPLVWNDFRELQLAIPFVLWSVQGWRERSPRLTALGIIGMLACRQEYALVAISLALLPPQRPEPPSRRSAWTLVVVVVGTAWLAMFLGYLAWRVDPHAPTDYIGQFTSPKSPWLTTFGRAIDALLVGLASWAVLAIFAPRVGLLAIPWAWVVSSGHWESNLIGTRHWHHVRYAAPLMALTLAAGLVGFARVAGLFSRVSGRIAGVVLWLLVAAGLMAETAVVQRQFRGVPRPISPAEAQRLWSIVHEVGPADGVFASYDVTAPLSSRRWLFSYELPENLPPGYPRLAPEIRWAFVRTGDFPPAMFLNQGFVAIDSGPFIRVFRRP